MVPDALLQLQEGIKARIKKFGEKSSADDDQLRRRMEARKHEWRKMTFFSRPLKKTDLADAHKKDLINLLSSDLRNRAALEDQKVLDQLARELGNLESAYRRCAAKVEVWHKKVSDRRNELRQELSNLHEDDVSNKCELSDGTLEAYVRAQRLEQDHLRNTTAQLRDLAILPAIGNGSLLSLIHI